MRNLYNALYIIFLLPLFARGAETQTLAPAEPFRLTVDCSRFRGGVDSVVHLELYYGIPRLALTYASDTAGYKGAGDLTVLVLRGDSIIFADRWLVPHLIRDTSNLQRGMNLIGDYAMELGAGDYVLKLIGKDRNAPDRADSVSFRLPIRLFPTNRTVMSDVEFATTIRQGVKGTMFYKNTLEVVPNVGGLYSEKQKCFYYAEVYNLLLDGNTSDYDLKCTVFDAVGKEVMSKERPRKRVAESSVLVDNLSVDKLRSGTYSLVLSVLDSGKQVLAQSGKKFFVYNPTLGVDSTLLASAASLPLQVYMSMQEPELDREFQWLRYESTDAEKGQYKELKGTEAKRKFMSDFWRKRSPEHRDEYLVRVGYTNSNFQMLGKEGYKTDRGRVYIMYGPPDDVERHPNESETRPYEIWSYNNIQGGVIFVFVQRNSGGDYELVHSTHRNELRDDNWDRVGITR